MSQPIASSTRGLIATQAVRGRGHGRGKARGQGRGRHLTTQHTDTPLEVQTTPRRPKPTKRAKPALTHFISLPIGHHASLRERISAFTTALQKTEPPIPGLDESIIIAPRRLHLTLGVMSLSPESSTPAGFSQHINVSRPATADPDNQPQSKTLSSALALLAALKPRIMSILGDHKLRIALDRMDIMKPDRGDLNQAHVLWLGPLLEGEDARRLREVCALVNKAFVEAGLVVDERRPLKLHCTVINTTYRKPRSKAYRRQPFSYASILASPAFEAICTDSQRSTTATAIRNMTATTSIDQKSRSASVDFGVWEAEEIQVCEMGSHGPEGEYVNRGGCSLVDNV